MFDLLLSLSVSCAFFLCAREGSFITFVDSYEWLFINYDQRSLLSGMKIGDLNVIRARCQPFINYVVTRVVSPALRSQQGIPRKPLLSERGWGRGCEISDYDIKSGSLGRSDFFENIYVVFLSKSLPRKFVHAGEEGGDGKGSEWAGANESLRASYQVFHCTDWWLYAVCILIRPLNR